MAEGRAETGVVVLQELGGEHHVGGRERFAVMPCDTFVQIEGVGHAVFGNLPAFGQRRLRFQIGIVAQQTLVDLARDHLCRTVLHKAQHQAGRFGLYDQVKAAAILLCGSARGQHRGHKEGCHLKVFHSDRPCWFGVTV